MTHVPETPPEIPPAAPAARRGVAGAVAARARTGLSALARGGRRMRAFMQELSGDHRFWLHMMAVRSGAAMTLLTLAGGVAVAMTLPFALAAMVITGLAFVGGLATVGIIAGARFTLARVRHAYAVIKHRDNPQAAPRAPVVMPALSDLALVRRVAGWPVSQKIMTTRAWRVTDSFMRRQKKWMLGGTALGGAAVTAGMGTWALLAKVTILPVVAVGSAVSLVTLWAVAGVISGTASLYFASHALMQWHRASKHKRAVAAQLAPQPAAGTATPDLARLSAVRPFSVAQNNLPPAAVNDNDDHHALPACTQAPPPPPTKRT